MYDYEVSGIIYELPVDEIHSSTEFNCRDFITPLNVKRLAETIEKDGKLLQAITVQPMEDVPPDEQVPQYKWRVVIGHRRFAAFNLLGRDTIPATIEVGLTAIEAARKNQLENEERSNLNLLESARGIGKAWSNFSDKEVAEAFKRPVKWVRVRRTLLEMPEEIQQAAASGRLSQYDVEFIGQVEARRRLPVFKQILAKKEGKNVSAPRVKGKTYGKNKCARRTLQEIKQMVAHIMELQQVHDTNCSHAMSALVWVLGNISTKELLEERLGLHHDENIFDD